jgi:glutamyl-tRNA reductase
LAFLSAYNVRVLDQLVILNLRREARDKLPIVLNSLDWRTCLRRILFLNKPENASLIAAAENDGGPASPVEIYRGEDAYRFLLEVICGLNSPLVGETAVLGQFREFVAHAKLPGTTWGNFLRQLISNLLVDAKRVRHDHLQGLGSQSYGSLVRQHLKGVPSVALLGGGQLAREILPWLIGKTQVRLFYRNHLHAQELLVDYPEIQLDRFSPADAGWEQDETGLVIAAPLKAAEVERWVGTQGPGFSRGLDLRGDAETDPVSLPFPVIKLSELFDALRNERERLAGRTEAARAEIKRLSQRQARQAQCRPFGWEDLCA